MTDATFYSYTLEDLHPCALKMRKEQLLFADEPHQNVRSSAKRCKKLSCIIKK